MTLFRVFVWAALAAFFVLAFGQSAQAAEHTASRVYSQPCPDEHEECRLAPPQSIQVNTAAHSGQANHSQVNPSGSLSPVELDFSLELTTASIIPTVQAAAPLIDVIDVSLRQQNPEDCACGVHALGMALEALEGRAPSSAELLGPLTHFRLMYGFDSGVEELAYAAQANGYTGSRAFHNRTIDQLQIELAQGRPVVVALGERADSPQEHFVTVTGISEDGQWIAYSDPVDGRVVASLESFLRMWGRQGKSGVTFGSQSVQSTDERVAPGWVLAVAGLLTAVGSMPSLGRSGGRKGIGGSRIEVDAGAELTGGPPYPAPHGYRWVPADVPVYKRRKVQTGWTIKQVPRMVRRRKQIGWALERVARYRTVVVQQGWTYKTNKVPKYSTIKTYPTVPVYVKGRIVSYKKSKKSMTKKILSGYKTVIRRTPRMVSRQVFSHWGYEQVPRYASVAVQEGWDEVRLPEYQWMKFRTGRRLEWKLRLLPKRPVSKRGYSPGTDSTSPLWLVEGSAPPWISDELWETLPAGDRQVISQTAEVVWRTWLKSESLTSNTPIDPDTPARIFDAYRPPGTKAQPMWVTSSDGLNLRTSPSTEQNANLIRRLISGSNVDWVGKVYLESLDDGRVRSWYKVNFSDEDQTWRGWVASDFLAPYASLKSGAAGGKAQRETLGYGLGAEGWSEYTNGSAAQYLNLRLLFQSLGDEEYGSYAFPHYGLCGPISVSEALGVPLEEGLRVYRDEVSKDWLLEDNKYGTTDSSDLRALFKAFGWEAINNYGSDNMKKALNEGKTVTALVTIDGRSGALDEQGNVAHWVHVRRMDGDQVEIFNPFNNRYVRVDEETFAASWAQTPNNSSQSLFISASR